jgi:hypothetical protein
LIRFFNCKYKGLEELIVKNSRENCAVNPQLKMGTISSEKFEKDME